MNEIRENTGESVHIHPQVMKVLRLYEDLFSAGQYSLPIVRQLELQVERLTEAHHHKDDAVCFQISSWHPRRQGMDDAQILDQAFTKDDGRITIAREYGFGNWESVIGLGEVFSDADFEFAVDAMLSGDLPLLKQQVEASPELVRERSRYGHGATLLHYAGTNGVESHRQLVPLNLAEIVEFLLDAGADPDCTANIYGGSTPFALFDSSRHSHDSNVHGKVAAAFARVRSR